MPHFTIRYRWVVLGCCVLAYATSYLTRWSYTGLASYISEDLHLDKADLGLLGAAFFYPYALAQVPWGKMTDWLGGRTIISVGILLSALGLGLFATSGSFEAALVWRMVIGLFAASAFVPIASVLGHWFTQSERGLANGVFYGLGGGLGQGAAFLLLPMIHIYLLRDTGLWLQGWQGATVLMALLLGIVGIGCLGFLQSFPPLELGRPSPETFPKSQDDSYGVEGGLSPPSSPFLKDPVLWFIGGYFAAGVIAIRLVAGWLVIFASDVSRFAWENTREEAVIAGGIFGTVYTLGHVLGSPLLGRLSDRLLSRGMSRLALSAGVLGVGALGIGILTMPMPSSWILGSVAFLLGIALHPFPVLNAAVAERWGIRRTGECLGWINMVGQIAGALALSASGFIGMAVSSETGNPLSEYTGIWYLGMTSCFIGAGCGWMAYRLSHGHQGSHTA